MLAEISPIFQTGQRKSGWERQEEHFDIRKLLGIFSLPFVLHQTDRFRVLWSSSVWWRSARKRGGVSNLHVWWSQNLLSKAIICEIFFCTFSLCHSDSVRQLLSSVWRNLLFDQTKLVLPKKNFVLDGGRKKGVEQKNHYMEDWISSVLVQKAVQESVRGAELRLEVNQFV